VALALMALGALLWTRQGHQRRETWDRIQARGALRVGMDASYPPFEWVDEAGAFHGYDVALGRALAARWGVEIEFINIHFDGLYDALYTGRVDLLLSALPYDRMLTRDVRYSQAYFAAGQVLLVPTADETTASPADLRGGTVAVELGATGHQLARSLDRDRALAWEVTPFRELDEAARTLVAGEADALICDRVSALALLAAYPLRVAGEPLTDEPFVIAVRPEAPRLLGEVDAALAAWQADGMLEHLAQEWLAP
jgi:ABC-type amino acid transport substrate-binding protein